MRSSRARSILSGLGAAALLLAAAGCGDDAIVVSSPGLEGAVDGASSPGGGIGVADPDAVRSTSSVPGVRAGAGASDTTGAPSPPTLSDAGQEALITATSVTTTAPPTSAQPTSAAPTTTVDPSTVSSDTSVGDGTGDSSTTTGPAGPSTSVGATPAELDVGEAHSSDLLNELRTSLDLPVLARKAEMDAFAREWSKKMAETGDLEHSSGPYGENIAFTSDVTLTPAEAADQFHQLWIGSPDHYANMTNDVYTTSGIGLYLTEKGWFGTHVFSFG